MDRDILDIRLLLNQNIDDAIKKIDYYFRNEQIYLTALYQKKLLLHF